MEKFKEKIEKVNLDPDYIEFLSYEEDAKKVHNTLVNNADEQGQKKKSIEIAKTMLKDKLPLDTISKYTGLSLKEIEALK